VASFLAQLLQVDEYRENACGYGQQSSHHLNKRQGIGCNGYEPRGDGNRCRCVCGALGVHVLVYSLEMNEKLETALKKMSPRDREHFEKYRGKMPMKALLEMARISVGEVSDADKNLVTRSPGDGSSGT
jgi:hypothetical protein